MIEALLAGVFGLLIGSFLNVCIFRLPRDLSVVRPRSYCPNCERPIAWYDNIPLLSYALLRGHCRRCAAAISWRYPMVELLTGALFFCSVYVLGPTAAAAKLAVFSGILVALVFSDLEERILPDEFTLGGTLTGLLFALVVPMEGGLWRMVLGGEHSARLLSAITSAFAACAGGFLLWAFGAIYAKIRRREVLGFGDVKMVAMIGAFLGLDGLLLTLIAGGVLGTAIGLLYIFLTGKDASTYELPFGSFLGAGALLVAFYEQWALRAGWQLPG